MAVNQQSDPLAILSALMGVGGGGGQGGVGPSFSQGLGMNTGTFQLGLDGLNSLGSLWSGFQAQKLAKEQFNFTKDLANTNLANQTKSYNTALEDRIRSRSATEGAAASDTAAYLAKNRL